MAAFRLKYEAIVLADLNLYIKIVARDSENFPKEI